MPYNYPDTYEITTLGELREALAKADWPYAVMVPEEDYVRFWSMIQPMNRYGDADTFQFGRTKLVSSYLLKRITSWIPMPFEIGGNPK